VLNPAIAASRRGPVCAKGCDAGSYYRLFQSQRQSLRPPWSSNLVSCTFTQGSQCITCGIVHRSPDKAVRKIFTVSKEDIVKEEAKWKRARARKRRAKKPVLLTLDAEGAVPLSLSGMQQFVLPFDNTQGFVTRRRVR
jgi:hypothetical protein